MNQGCDHSDDRSSYGGAFVFAVIIPICSDHNGRDCASNEENSHHSIKSCEKSRLVGIVSGAQHDETDSGSDARCDEKKDKTAVSAEEPCAFVSIVCVGQQIARRTKTRQTGYQTQK